MAVIVETIRSAFDDIESSIERLKEIQQTDSRDNLPYLGEIEVSKMRNLGVQLVRLADKIHAKNEWMEEE